MLAHNLKNLLIFEDEGEGGGNVDMTMDLLWENSAPGTAFPKQVITVLHIEDYKMLYIEYRPRAEFSTLYATMIKVDKSVPHSMFGAQVFTTTGDSTIRDRQYQYLGYSSVDFGYGVKVQLNTSLTASQDNSSCVPVRIYGIK